MQLLLIPVLLAAGGYWFSQYQADQNQRNAADQQRETALNDYVGQMSSMLLDKPDPLATPELWAPAQELARTRTVFVLRELDPARRALVLHFLGDERLLLVGTVTSSISDSAAIMKVLAEKNSATRTQLLTPVVRLYGADFSGADVPNIGLHDANLARVNFNQAGLHSADLRRAILCASQLAGADLSDADLRGAVLYGANLENANLRGANLAGAYADWKDLLSAKLDPAARAEVRSLNQRERSELAFLGC